MLRQKHIPLPYICVPACQPVLAMLRLELLYKDLHHRLEEAACKAYLGPVSSLHRAGGR